MKLFHFATTVVACPIDLPGLAVAEGPADVTITFDTAPLAEIDIDWVALDSSDSFLRRAGLARSLFVMDFEADGSVRIQIDPENHLIVVSIPAGADDSAVEHIVADSALPHYLSLVGTPVLHASAVEIEGAALVALGESGAGKSTLAASLVQSGARLIADDAVVIDDDPSHGLCVYPVGRDLRLYADSVEASFTTNPTTRPVGAYTDKHHVELGPSNYVPLGEPIVLGTVVGLSDDEVLAPIRMGAGDRVRALEQSFFGALGPSRSRKRRFDAMTQLAQRVSVWHIGIEWTIDGTNRAISEIRALHRDHTTFG